MSLHNLSSAKSQPDRGYLYEINLSLCPFTLVTPGFQCMEIFAFLYYALANPF